MFSVKGGGYILELYIMFNFKIFVYNIWPRDNEIFIIMVNYLFIIIV